jgi:hypothetical protein
MNGETFRMKLTVPRNSEPAYINPESVPRYREPPESMTVSATVVGLTPGTAYTVLKFT